MGGKSIFSSGVILAFIPVLLLLAGCEQLSSPNKQIDIIFRYDDYSATSNTNLESSLIDIFRTNHMPITISVIPFEVANNVEDQAKQNLLALPISKAEILKNAKNEGIVDIALHGYSHQTHRQKPFSEFAGLNYHAQLTRLESGKTYLEWLVDSPVTIFVPPWNRFDRTTLIAMQTLGFTTISASTSGEAIDGSRFDLLPSPCSPLKQCIVSVPATCTFYSLKDCILAAYQSEYKQPTIVVLVHAYDFLEDNPSGFTTLKDVSEVLPWLKLQKGINVISMSTCKRELNLLPQNLLFSQAGK